MLDTIVPRLNEDYLLKTLLETERRVTKRLSQKFSRTKIYYLAVRPKWTSFCGTVKFGRNAELLWRHPRIMTKKIRSTRPDLRMIPSLRLVLRLTIPLTSWCYTPTWYFTKRSLYRLQMQPTIMLSYSQQNWQAMQYFRNKLKMRPKTPNFQSHVRKLGNILYLGIRKKIEKLSAAKDACLPKVLYQNWYNRWNRQLEQEQKNSRSAARKNISGYLSWLPS